MKMLRIFSAVAAIHIVVMAFFFFKPTVRYFTTTCVSTVLVWAAVFAVKHRTPWIMAAGFIVQLSMQSYAYRAWQAEQSAIWWPLVHFVALQYLVVLSLNSPGPPQSP